VAKTYSRDAFVHYLEGSLGRDAANSVVVSVCRELRLNPNQFTLETGLQVCERIAQEPGLVGIAGRFAKMKLILEWGGTKKG